jgi:hypothetical protein
VKKILKFLLAVLVCLSCANNSESNIDNTEIDKKKNQKLENEDSQVENSMLFLNQRSVLFFSLTNKEYNNFINKMGAETKWEFDIIYKNFKKTAENAVKSLESKNIQSEYSTDQIIGFISKKNDTLFFNRTDDDYFVGQVFYNGSDSLLIKEGLYKTNELEDLLIDFFSIDPDFNISYVPEITDSFRYYSPDTILINNDSI